MKVIVAVGTRPEIIKMSPIISEILARDHIELCLVHTGQHYEVMMSEIFFRELEIPMPHVYLGVGSGSDCYQLSKIVSKAEQVLRKGADIVLVEGDTNSALGMALSSVKCGIPVGHIEAGCRSFDRDMPEEINRILIADLASFHFAPTRVAVENLLREGVPRNSIFLTGHPIVDVVYKMLNRISGSDIMNKLSLKSKDFITVTVHRRENVDHLGMLRNIVSFICTVAQNYPVVFPVHPRTSKRLREFGLYDMLVDQENLHLIPPVSYTDMLALIKHAKIVITDSGGVQQEAYLLNTPCITLRKTTEWIETVEAGVNFLVRVDDRTCFMQVFKKVVDKLDEIALKLKNKEDIFGRPGVSKRIVNIIEERFRNMSDLERKKSV